MPDPLVLMLMSLALSSSCIAVLANRTPPPPTLGGSGSFSAGCSGVYLAMSALTSPARRSGAMSLIGMEGPLALTLSAQRKAPAFKRDSSHHTHLAGLHHGSATSHWTLPSSLRTSGATQMPWPYAPLPDRQGPPVVACHTCNITSLPDVRSWITLSHGLPSRVTGSSS